VNRRERAEALLLAHCEAAAQHTPPALRAAQDAGCAVFAAQGLPGVQLEEWRYSSTAPIADFALSALADSDSAAPGASAPIPNSICEVPAAFRDMARPLAASAPALLGALVDVKEHPFAALNAALLQDGLHLRIPAGRELAEPLRLLLPAARGLSNPRIVIEAEPGSRAVVVQEHPAPGAAEHFCNAVTEVQLGAGAAMHYVLLQRGNGLLVCNLAVRQERDSHFASHTLTLGGPFVRNDLSLSLAGSGASCEMNGLCIAFGGLLDNHTAVDHAMPQCTSRQLYKGVLGGSARGVFRGRVRVRPGAQQSDAQQSNPNLLLADSAEMDSKPQLEIHADDVKCSHGASMGRLDDEALFYLQSRGLGANAARAMLVRGFAGEMLDALPASLGPILPNFSAQLRECIESALAAEAAQ